MFRGTPCTWHLFINFRLVKRIKIPGSTDIRPQICHEVGVVQLHHQPRPICHPHLETRIMNNKLPFKSVVNVSQRQSSKPGEGKFN